MDIPIFDLKTVADASPDQITEWERAAADFGCFGVTGHAVEETVLADCVAAAEEFFSAPGEIRERVSITRSLNVTGYVGHQLTAVDGNVASGRYYSSVDFGPELVPDAERIESILLGSNKWPDLPDFRRRVEAYGEQVAATARVVSQMFASVCGLDRDHIAEQSDRGCSMLRLLHYPVPANRLAQAPGGHTDYEWFALVWQSAPGLEVSTRDGSTLAVPASPQTLWVLVGDLVEQLSGGLLPSTLHSVRPADADRYSLTYFYGPNFDAEISPVASRRPHGSDVYAPIDAGRHLTGLRVRHIAHLRAAVASGELVLPFELPRSNPFKANKERRAA